MTDQQKELFPMASHIVEKLTDYSGSIIREIEKLDDAIEKKRDEIMGLKDKLEDVQLAIREAAEISIELTPKAEAEEPVDFGPDGQDALTDETEEEKLRTMDEPGPEEEEKG